MVLRFSFVTLILILTGCGISNSDSKLKESSLQNPFEASSCQGDSAHLQDFIKYFEPGSSFAKHNSAQLLMRERTWNKFTGVGPWVQSVVPDMPFVKIHTYNIGGSDFADTTRSIHPVMTTFALKNDIMTVTVENFSYPTFGNNRSVIGIACQIYTDAVFQCEDSYQYPWKVSTREGSDRMEVDTTKLEYRSSRNSQPIVFTGTLTPSCLRFSSQLRDEAAGLEREYVIFQAF